MRKAKILVVEDDSRVVIFLEDQLENLGHRVIIARNGMEALEKIQDDKPDLIVLDVMMPEMDGYEVSRRLKLSPETKNIPIIMLTAKGQLQDKIKGFDRGADDYLPKPYDKSELDARVTALLKRSVSPPFDVTPIDSVLCISCKPEHRLNIRLEGRVAYTATTKRILDIDPNIFARQGDNTGTFDWRFNSKQLGEQLYQKVFAEHPEILSNYNHTLGIVENEERLHLRFESNRDILRVPLEFLFADRNYLVLKHPVARTISDVRIKKRPLSPNFFNELWTKDEKLRIILIASNTKPFIPGVDQEINILSTSIEALFDKVGIGVQLKVIPTQEATYDIVRKELKKCSYHIVHYAGHGAYDVDSPEKSSIFFWEKPNCQGGVKQLSISELQMVLRDSDVRFVYLSCCLGTATGESVKLLDDDFLGIADGLVHANIPAVLGFRWSVSDGGAVTLSLEFYKSLTEGGQIDAALLNARCAVAAKDRDDITWLSPILIMQD